MAYSIFSQPSGPQVDVSLFGDAANAGIQGGANLPTTTTSIIRGVTEGIQTGQQIQTNQQQIELNKQRLEQAPLDTELKEAQIEGQQITNQGARQKLQQEEALIQRENEFLSQYQALANQPQAQAQLVLSGKYADVLGKDPNLGKQVVTQIGAAGGFTQSQMDSLQYQFGAKSIQNKYQELAQREYPNYLKAKGEYDVNKAIDAAAEEAGISRDMVGSKIDFRPAGKFKVEAGKIVPLSAEEALVTPSTSGTYDMFVTGEQGTIKISRPATQEEYDNRNRFLQQQAVQTGLAAEREIKQTLKVPGAGKTAAEATAQQESLGPNAAQENLTAPKGTQVSIPGVDQLSGKNKLQVWRPNSPTITDEDTFKQGSIGMLQIPEATYEANKDTFASIADVLIRDTSKPKTLTDVAMSYDDSTALEASKQDLTNIVAKENFNRLVRTSPAIRLKYNERAVAAHNEEVERARSVANSSRFGFGDDLSRVVNPEYLSQMNNKLTTVQTPEELYALDNKANYEAVVDNYVSTVRDSIYKFFQAPTDIEANRAESQAELSSAGANAQNPRQVPLPDIQEKSTPTELEDIINSASEEYGLPKELIDAVISKESSGNKKAISNKGARGLMQLMPATAEELGVTDIEDPYQNVMAGAKYLRKMLDRYDGDIMLALAAYNAGPGNVDKFEGIPPFRETRNYVQNVLSEYERNRA